MIPRAVKNVQRRLWRPNAAADTAAACAVTMSENYFVAVRLSIYVSQNNYPIRNYLGFRKTQLYQSNSIAKDQ